MYVHEVINFFMFLDLVFLCFLFWNQMYKMFREAGKDIT